MEINLKENSLHANFYRKSYGFHQHHLLPQSICNYSWALLWAILWLPLTWWSYIWAAIPFLKIKNTRYWLWKRIVTGFCTYLFIGIAWLIIYKCINNPDKFFQLLKEASVIVGVIIGGLIIWAITHTTYTKIIPSLKHKAEKKEGYKIISGTFYSIKNKVCPKIKWKNY